MLLIIKDRTGPPSWPGGDEAWREFRSKEPVNAHSHLIAFVLGTSESIPVHKGEIKIGTYQNIIVVSCTYPGHDLAFDHPCGVFFTLHSFCFHFFNPTQERLAENAIRI
jgi:hypothetical protein